MKTFFTTSIIALQLLAFHGPAQSQLTSNSVFTGNDLVWYGLDFSEARFIGKFDQGFNRNHVSATELIGYYMPAWNQLVLDEPLNFDLKSTFRKTSVYYDIRPVRDINSKINPEDLLSYNTHVLAKEKLAGMLGAYAEGDKKEGLGLVFIVESFDKSYLKASYWIVFFDIKTKTVLFSDYCTSAPVGFGLRNYWAGSLKRVLNEIRFRRYDVWKKNAGRDNRQVAAH